jgi:hypothetical protein
MRIIDELSLADRRGYLSETNRQELQHLASRTCRALRGLVRAPSDQAQQRRLTVRDTPT